MRRLGVILMSLGITVGAAMAILVLVGGPRAWSMDWVQWVGSVKLGVLSALGLITTGAIVRRIAIRQDQREGAALDQRSSR